MQDADRTPAVAQAPEPLDDTDGSRQAAIGQPAQLAIDQVIRNERGIAGIVAQRGHDAHGQLTGFWNG
jgi:hypothetical protein